MNVMIGPAEFLRHLHEAQGLAIAFRIGHPEVPLHAFLEGLALLMADDHDRPVVEAGEAADDGAVIAERAVAVEFVKVPEDFTM